MTYDIKGLRGLVATRNPPKGWRSWGENLDLCNHCCNGDRCDEPSHKDRQHCQYCLGTGYALWLPKFRSPNPMDFENSFLKNNVDLCKDGLALRYDFTSCDSREQDDHFSHVQEELRKLGYKFDPDDYCLEHDCLTGLLVFDSK